MPQKNASVTARRQPRRNGGVCNGRKRSSAQQKGNRRPVQQGRRAAPPPESDERFKKIRKIAKGGYGKVYLAHALDHMERGHVVIKKMDLAHYDDFIKEVHFLRDLRETCPEYFPEIYEIFPEISTQRVFMCMKHYDCDLHTLASCDKYNELLIPLTQQILEAYAVIERHFICHFDLKLDNILVEECRETGMPQIKIIDWGFAQFYRPLERSTAICTDVYRAPELFTTDDLSYGLEIDLWSIGCLMVGYLTKQFLFDGKNSRQIARRIPTILQTFPFDLCDQVNPIFGFLVKGFLSLDGAIRKATYESVRQRLYRRQWLFDEMATELRKVAAEEGGLAVVETEGDVTACDYPIVDYRHLVLRRIISIEEIERTYAELKLSISLADWINLWGVIGRFCLHHEEWSEGGNVFSWLYQRAYERILVSPRKTATVHEVRRFVVCLLCIANQIYCYEPFDVQRYLRLLKRMGTEADYRIFFHTVLQLTRNDGRLT